MRRGFALGDLRGIEEEHHILAKCLQCQDTGNGDTRQDADHEKQAAATRRHDACSIATRRRASACASLNERRAASTFHTMMPTVNTTDGHTDDA
jgi:hypothetical protein